jgi:hypothetical protein
MRHKSLTELRVRKQRFRHHTAPAAQHRFQAMAKAG